MVCTFVIVLVITTVLFQCNGTITTVPALIASTLPQTLTAHPTLSMIGTASRTAFDRTVFSIPAGHTQACTVLALTVLITTGITELRITVFTTPALVARTRFTNASTVQSTV